VDYWLIFILGVVIEVVVEPVVEGVDVVKVVEMLEFGVEVAEFHWNSGWIYRHILNLN